MSNFFKEIIFENSHINNNKKVLINAYFYSFYMDYKEFLKYNININLLNQ